MRIEDVSVGMPEYLKKGLVEVLGPEAVADFSQMMEAFPADPIVRGMMIRAGRAGFHYWLAQEGETLEKADAGFHLSPIKKKINTGLQHFCATLSSNKRYALEFKDHDKKWELAMTAAERSGVFSLECSFLSGFMQEFASWAGMGKLYLVRENGCKNNPSHCSILIEKDPVE